VPANYADAEFRAHTHKSRGSSDDHTMKMTIIMMMTTTTELLCRFPNNCDLTIY